MIAPDRLTHLRDLETHLRSRLRGQDHVIGKAAAIFTRGEMGLVRRDKPRGTLLAVGPTGTGKTELVLLAAQHLFGPGHVCRLDLSEFQRDDALERLLGTGASDDGAMGRYVPVPAPRVWLFDELEKAHPKVFDLFIQLLEPGRLTLASGKVVSFLDDYVAFTSNVGAGEAMRMARSNPASIEQAVLRRLAECLRPEILARIPDKLVFGRLTPQIQREIAELHLQSEVARLGHAGYDLQISRDALEFLIREGFHPQLGARPLRQTIERHLQDAVVRSLFAHGAASGRIEVDASQNCLALRPL